MTTTAERQLALIADRPHASTRREILRTARMLYPVADDGFTERFSMPDGSVLIYDHTANPGHEWRAE